MRTLRRLFVVLVVVAVLLVVADRATDHFLERGIEDSLAAAPGVVTPAPGSDVDTSGDPTSGPVPTGDDGSSGAGGSSVSGDLSVQVEGLPLLTQLLAGELDSLRVHLPAYDVDTEYGTLRVSDIDAHLTGVDTSAPHTTRDLTATAAITTRSLAPLASAAGVPGTLTTGDEGVTLSLDVLGQQATMTVTISPDGGGRSLVLTPTSASMAGLDVPLDLVRVVAGGLPTIPLDGLPEGIRVTELGSGPEGLSVDLIGQEVSFGEFAS